jgi:hypothetical protein
MKLGNFGVMLAMVSSVVAAEVPIDEDNGGRTQSAPVRVVAESSGDFSPSKARSQERAIAGPAVPYTLTFLELGDDGRYFSLGGPTIRDPRLAQILHSAVFGAQEPIRSVVGDRSSPGEGGRKLEERSKAALTIKPTDLSSAPESLPILQSDRQEPPKLKPSFEPIPFPGPSVVRPSVGASFHGGSTAFHGGAFFQVPEAPVSWSPLPPVFFPGLPFFPFCQVCYPHHPYAPAYPWEFF